MRTSDQSTQTVALQGGDTKKQKELRLPLNSKLTEETIMELDTLLDFVPAQRLSRKLRDIFMYYLYHEKDHLPCNFRETVEDLQLLFGFLDRAEPRNS